MLKLIMLSTTWLAAMFGLSACQAGFVLQFSPNNTLNELQLNVGDTFSVNIYLAQTGSENRLVDDGLVGFGVRGTYNSSILQSTGGSVNPAFAITPTVDSTQPGQVDAFGGSLAPPQQAAILLTTVNFQAILPGVTSLSVGDLDNGLSDFALNDLATTDLDPILFGASLNQTYSLNITVVAVPEPTILPCVLALSMLFRNRRSARRVVDVFRHSAKP